MEKYLDVISNTNEVISSSPSGIHYDHYKVTCKSKILTKVNLIFMTLPFKMRIPVSMWTRSLHCMIQKVCKAYMTKLRIVRLYDVAFNTMLKRILGWRLIQHSESID